MAGSKMPAVRRNLQPRPRGRPSKLTHERQAKICDAIRAGNYLETAAAFAGIDKTTMYLWMRKGRAANRGKHREFVDAVEKAMADAEARDVALIGKAAADGTWQAAAWRLERKHPDRWGRRDHHRVEAAVLTAEVNADDAVAELSRLLARQFAGGGAPQDT